MFLTFLLQVMYLYNMFQNQVQDYCESTTCKHDLKNYGWNKLKTMGEDHLDKMDPFQRDSNSISKSKVINLKMSKFIFMKTSIVGLIFLSFQNGAPVFLVYIVLYIVYINIGVIITIS